MATRLNPRMKELSPFLNDNNRESTFKYLLELMDDDLNGVSGIDSSNKSEINKEAVDTNISR